jgi:hypothetical protein
MEPPPSPNRNDQGEMRMQRTRLANLLDVSHPMVKLARGIDWHGFDEHFGAYYARGKGRPVISTRLMVSLHYLKYTKTTSPTRRLCADMWRSPTGSTSRGWSSSATRRPSTLRSGGAPACKATRRLVSSGYSSFSSPPVCLPKRLPEHLPSRRLQNP